MKQALARLAAVSIGGGLAVAVATAALADHSQETAVTTFPESTVTKGILILDGRDGPACDFQPAKLDEMGEPPSAWTLTGGGVLL